MKICEMMNLCTEPGLCKVTIYCSETASDIWTGDGDDIPTEYGELEIDSFDVSRDGRMTFNVSC